MDDRELLFFLRRIAELAAHDSPDNVQFFTLANGTNLNAKLPFYPQSVVVDNHSSAYLDFLDAGDGNTGRFVPPNQPAVLPILNRTLFARVKWVAPPGKVQPTAITSEQAQIIFFRNPIPPGQGLASQAPLVRWNVNATPVTGSAASATKAAAAGTTHVGDSALFSWASAVAPAAAAQSAYQILDGVNNLATGVMSVQAVAGASGQVPLGPGLNYRGTVNTDMTISFAGGLSNTSQRASLSGFDQ